MSILQSLFFIISIENNLDTVKINHYDNYMEKEKYHHGDLKLALVESGMRILKENGLSALSLRSAARVAGVSHSAPYAHFADKQSLLAAISTRGFSDLYNQISNTTERYFNSPADLLVETGWTYVSFALSDGSLFKLMFSGILEDEHSYPDFMEAVRRTYSKLEEMVTRCQTLKVLPDGPVDKIAVAVWSQVHGFVSLYLERQFPGRVLEKNQLKKLLADTLQLLEADNS